jgi:hypothetical protein
LDLRAAFGGVTTGARDGVGKPPFAFVAAVEHRLDLGHFGAKERSLKTFIAPEEVAQFRRRGALQISACFFKYDLFTFECLGVSPLFLFAAQRLVMNISGLVPQVQLTSFAVESALGRTEFDLVPLDVVASGSPHLFDQAFQGRRFERNCAVAVSIVYSPQSGIPVIRDLFQVRLKFEIGLRLRIHAALPSAAGGSALVLRAATLTSRSFHRPRDPMARSFPTGLLFILRLFTAGRVNAFANGVGITLLSNSAALEIQPAAAATTAGTSGSFQIHASGVSAADLLIELPPKNRPNLAAGWTVF